MHLGYLFKTFKKTEFNNHCYVHSVMYADSHSGLNSMSSSILWCWKNNFSSPYLLGKHPSTTTNLASSVPSMSSGFACAMNEYSSVPAGMLSINCCMNSKIGDSSSLKLTTPVGLRVTLKGKIGSSSFPSWSYLKESISFMIFF